MLNRNIRMPAEWELHAATWIAWPHNVQDWPGKFQPIRWVFAEITRVLSRYEHVNILCSNDAVLKNAARCLSRNNVKDGSFTLHIVPTDRAWTRDSGPIAVWNNGQLTWTGAL